MLFSILFWAMIGFVFGRLPGLLIGGFIGFLIARVVRQGLQQGIGRIQSRFFNTTFAVMGALCKADGQVSTDEIRTAERLFDELRLSADQREEAKAAFRRGKAEDFDLEAELQELLRLTRGQRPLLQLFIQVQLAAIAADGQVHPAERNMLLRIARTLGLSESEMDRIEAMLGGGAGSTGDTGQAGGIEQAYQVLGVSPEASDHEIKKAYRRLMSENHPDKLASKGLPESMREMAERKTREITQAYDRIRQHRGR